MPSSRLGEFVERGRLLELRQRQVVPRRDVSRRATALPELVHVLQEAEAVDPVLERRARLEDLEFPPDAQCGVLRQVVEVVLGEQPSAPPVDGREIARDRAQAFEPGLQRCRIASANVTHEIRVGARSAAVGRRGSAQGW
jgi:hypothetical protein